MNQSERFQFEDLRVNFLRRGVLYPDCYTWLVFGSALDLMFTWVIFHLGGWEANPLAAIVIDRFDLVGAVAFKFGLLVLVILICEFVGRRRPSTGRMLAVTTVAIPLAGVVAGSILMIRTIL